jgi:hypothetical protein
MAEPSLQIAAIFLKFAEKYGASILGIANRAGSKIVDAISQNFSAYYETTIFRCSNIKTLISRDAPISIYSIYVKTYFARARGKTTTIDDEQFINSLATIRAAVILGGAGSGKSVFMRHLFLSLANSNLAILPLFVELRGLNSPDPVDLLSYIYKTITSPGGSITPRQLERGIKSGAFYLILDGFDEVGPDIRSAIEAAILDLQRNNRHMVIVVTSRPDERFYSWQNFTTFSVLPMKKKEVVQLIKKLPYEPSIRAKFAEAVQKELYQKHESFLSNPLLATMMLITYEQFAHIPDKVHIFYEQAFETLFFRHDTSKEAAFQRKRNVDLPINEFKNCLSSLCISTYVRGTFQFSQSQILEAIAAACEYERIDCPPAGFLQDLLESVCIVQRDGTFFTFTHRSFQEYFSAFFISRNPSIKIDKLLDSIMSRSEDNVIGMAFDINRDLIERKWVLPRIRSLVKKINTVRQDDLVGFGLIAYGHFALRKLESDYTLTLNEITNSTFSFCLNRLYPNLFERVFEPLNKLPDNAMIDQKYEDRLRGKLEKGGAENDMAPREYQLTVDDNEWVSLTSVGEFLRRSRQALIDTLSNVSKSVEHAEVSGRNLLFKR